MRFVHVKTWLDLRIFGTPCRRKFRIGFQVHVVRLIQADQSEYFPGYTKNQNLIIERKIFRSVGKRQTGISNPLQMQNVEYYVMAKVIRLLNFENE